MKRDSNNRSADSPQNGSSGSSAHSDNPAAKAARDNNPGVKSVPPWQWEIDALETIEEWHRRHPHVTPSKFSIAESRHPAPEDPGSAVGEYNSDGVPIRDWFTLNEVIKIVPLGRTTIFDLAAKRDTRFSHC